MKPLDVGVRRVDSPEASHVLPTNQGGVVVVILLFSDVQTVTHLQYHTLSVHKCSRR